MTEKILKIAQVNKSLKFFENIIPPLTVGGFFCLAVFNCYVMKSFLFDHKSSKGEEDLARNCIG